MKRILGRHALVWWTAASLLLGSLPSSALAEPTAADKASAKDYFREGKELRSKGDHAGALKKFSAAYATLPTPITGLAVATEQAALGLLVEARETLGEIDRLPAKATESAEAKAARDETAKLLPEMLLRIPIVEVRTAGAPPDGAVTITVDGRVIPSIAAAEGWRVNPGRHTIVGTTPGRPEQRLEIDLAERERKKVDLTFPEPPPAKPVAPAKTEKPAEAAAPPPPTATAGPLASSMSDVGSTGSGQRTVGVALAAGGVVVGALGGYLALKGSDRFANPGDDAGICDASCQANQSSGQTTTRWGLGLVGVGAAAAVTGVVVWAIAPRAPKTASSGALVALTPGGFVLRASF